MSNGLKFLWKDSSPNDEIKKQVEANTNDIATINTKFNDYYTKTQVATAQAGQDALIQENMTNIENLIYITIYLRLWRIWEMLVI